MSKYVVIFVISGLIFSVDYESQIQPIFDSHCGNCHLGNSSGGLNLSNYENLMSTDVVIAGDHISSILYDRITRSDATAGDMPPSQGDSLSADEIALIAQWIDEGALSDVRPQNLRASRPRAFPPSPRASLRTRSGRGGAPPGFK